MVKDCVCIFFIYFGVSISINANIYHFKSYFFSHLYFVSFLVRFLYMKIILRQLDVLLTVN